MMMKMRMMPFFQQPPQVAEPTVPERIPLMQIGLFPNPVPINHPWTLLLYRFLLRLYRLLLYHPHPIVSTGLSDSTGFYSYRLLPHRPYRLLLYRLEPGRSRIELDLAQSRKHLYHVSET